LTGELGEKIVEQSLIVEGEKGPVLITGCAHPGIVEIARSATKIVGKPLQLVLGGFHLYGKVAAEVEEIAASLKELNVKRVAPCHCTGPKAMKVLKESFGTAYLVIKVGSEVRI
jgi:7,8-dihydropterin-6-yl-methyl-4-(beta-D-ribofuranosyl)aminobenzene 5'-phosphate synthase